MPTEEKTPASRPRGRPGKARPVLLKAAIAEFAQKGFAGATTAGIARRAKAPQPLVHHHFGSKEKLFRLVLDTLFAELRAAMLPPEGEPAEPISLIRRFVLFTAKRPELARIWIIESARKGSHAEYVMEKHIRPLTEWLRPLLLAASRDGTLPDVDALLLLYAIQGLASYPFLVPAQVRHLSRVDAGAQAFAESYADVVLSLLIRDRASRRDTAGPRGESEPPSGAARPLKARRGEAAERRSRAAARREARSARRDPTG